MKNTTLKQSMRAATLLMLAVLLAVPSLAADITVNLAAVEAQWLPPGGAAGSDEIPMWGFIADPGDCSGGLADWNAGPRIPATAGDNLTINLRNCLGEPVSIFVPGQQTTLAPVFSGNRMTSLTATAPNDGGASLTTYVWNNVAAGTYLYHSGTNLSKQVHMGLYGALTVDAAPGIAYNGTLPVSYDNEVMLMYSEIDPDLHASAGSAHPNGYHPRYFLINGQAYDTPPLFSAGAVGQTTLVRMLSACLDDIVPTIVGSHWDLIAEDGNRYPYPKTQNTVLLSAMKTTDATLTPQANGSFAVFDRRLNLTNAATSPGGMLALLDVASGALTAANDTASTPQDAPVDIFVLANDGTDPTLLSVDSITQPANGSVLNNGTDVTYTPNTGFAGSDSFTYRASDGTNLSNWATVAVTVSNLNDPPVANPDSYEATAGTPLVVTAPGVLTNDSDPDGDPLTAVLDTDAGAGTLTFNGDGSFSYTPNAGTTTDSFTYFANDGTVDSTSPATVTITVTAAPTGPPVANDDFAQTTRNQPVAISILGNDTDAAGNAFDPATASLTVDQGTRGGTVTILTNNSVTYTPSRNFRGTETFTYSFNLNGQDSNTATVTVNVVK